MANFRVEIGASVQRLKNMRRGINITSANNNITISTFNFQYFSMSFALFVVSQWILTYRPGLDTHF